MKSRYCYSLSSQAPKEKTSGGVRKKANKEYLPVLEGLALYWLELESGGIREPHWHLDANELCYCISGKAQIGIFAPKGSHQSFMLEPGEIAFIPKGYLHYIENAGDTKTTLAIGFNHAMPDELSLSTVFSASLPEVMSATFDQDPAFFSRFPKLEKSVVITKRQQKAMKEFAHASSHKFKLSAIDPQVDKAGGTISIASKENFSILEGITVFDLRLTIGGVREPHWHPNAAELDYVIAGRARMLIMAPDGTKEVFEVHAGDVVFIPSAYFHYIENIGQEELHFCVFFNHESPEDIGISGSLGAFPSDVYAAVLGVDVKDVEPLSSNHEDVFIGPRVLR